MTKYFISILIFLSITAIGQNSKKKIFEGKIKFARITRSDTTYFSYLVKGNKVRVISYDPCVENEEMQEYLLFDMDKQKIYAVKPSYKTFIELQNKPYVKLPDKEFKIIKSINNKEILGEKCYQWRIKNKKENTEIAFWVSDKYNFSFFVPLLKLWNHTEKHAKYFLQIPDNKGYFPFLSTERSTLRNFRMKLAILDIQYMKLPDSLFTLYSDYTNYDH